MDEEQRARRWFVAVWTIVTVVKVAIAARLPLFVDEAFYWQEGQHLAAAYSDLPGLTAWLTRLGVELGGHHVLAVRAPFLLIAAVLPWLVARWPGGAVMPAPARLVKLGLAATVLLTLGMALPLPGAWPALRFAAGVASALVFLNVSVWCMVRLVALGHAALGGLIFCGPGLGIVLTGLSASAMVALGWPAAAGWAVFGVLADKFGQVVVDAARMRANLDLTGGLIVAEAVMMAPIANHCATLNTSPRNSKPDSAPKAGSMLIRVPKVRAGRRVRATISRL